MRKSFAIKAFSGWKIIGKSNYFELFQKKVDKQRKIAYTKGDKTARTSPQKCVTCPRGGFFYEQGSGSICR